MGLHSELGPIDPQILVPVPEGQRFAPAHAILRDFERAKQEIGANVAVLPTWTPILRGYMGGLIEFCNQQINLSQDIVTRWLAQHMLSHSDVGISDPGRGRGRSQATSGPKPLTIATGPTGARYVLRNWRGSQGCELGDLRRMISCRTRC
jgi:hypothetical protein